MEEKKTDNYSLPDLDDLSKLSGLFDDLLDDNKNSAKKVESNKDIETNNNSVLPDETESNNVTETKNISLSESIQNIKSKINTEIENSPDPKQNTNEKTNVQTIDTPTPKNNITSQVNTETKKDSESPQKIESNKTAINTKETLDKKHTSEQQSNIEQKNNTENKANNESKKDSKSVNQDNKEKIKKYSKPIKKPISKSSVQHRPIAKKTVAFKPKKKSSCFKVLFILFMGFAAVGGATGYIVYKGKESYELMDKAVKITTNPPEELKSKLPEFLTSKHDDENFPQYAKKFMPNPKLYEEISKIDTLVPRGKDLGNYFMEEKLFENINTIIPENIKDYKTEFIPLIKAKMSEKKKNEAPSYESRNELPDSPTLTAYRNSIRYWNLLSRYYDNKRDYDTSLLLVHSIFYLSKDLTTEYSSSGFVASRLVNLINNSLACDSILNWASKPKLNSHKLAKLVAKDILDFVNKEQKISHIIIYEEKHFDTYMNVLFEHFENGKLAYVRETEEYKNLIDYLYKKPLDYIDKPLYEIQQNLDETRKKLDNLYSQNALYSLKETSTLLKTIFKPEPFIVNHLVLRYYTNYERIKIHYEETLAKMEFTAIALAINSFYCEKSRLPSSIGELSNWFGQELPNNRLTNKPYKLDFDGQYLMYTPKGTVENEYFFNIAR